MDELERLQANIEKAVREIKRLKEERAELMAEVEILRQDNERARVLMRENESLKRIQLRFKTRLERIAEKLSGTELH